MEMQSERRRSERKVSNIPVSYRIGNTQVTSYTHDLSRNGMFLESEVLLDEGEVFPVGFSLPNGKGVFEGFGRVVYQNKIKGESGKMKSRGMGLELFGCTGRDEGILTTYLSKIPTVDSPETLEVTKVMTKKALDQFIGLPFTLYKDSPHWIPPLKSEVRKMLTQENPFLKHGEMDLFLVKDRNRVVGRIAAIIDHDFIDLYKEKTGYFGFFECIPDFNVAKKLFDSAAHTLKAKGMEKMRGPLSPSLNDEICFVVEGLESPPNIMMPYNPLYYDNFARGYGMYKVKDFFSFWVNLKRDVPRDLMQIVKNNEQEGVVFRKFNMKNFSADVELLRQLNNRSWLEAGHWGFVPITSEEMRYIAESFRMIVNPDIIYFAEISGNPVGYVINLPNFFPALKHLNGKFSPAGIMKFLYHLKKIKNVRAVSVGVFSEYGGRKIALSLFVKSILEMQKKGYDSMEYVWVLEDNTASRTIVSKFDGRLYKRYRMYDYPI